MAKFNVSRAALGLTDNILEAAADPLDKVTHISGFAVLDLLALKSK